MESFESWLDKYTDEHGAPYATTTELKAAWNASREACAKLVEELDPFENSGYYAAQIREEGDD
jgi:hypothetical protein